MSVNLSEKVYWSFSARTLNVKKYFYYHIWKYAKYVVEFFVKQIKTSYI